MASHLCGFMVNTTKARPLNPVEHHVLLSISWLWAIQHRHLNGQLQSPNVFTACFKTN